AIEVTGRDLDDLFATAAQAVAVLMADPRTVPLTVERTVSLSASREDLLLYDWLSELILRKDRDQEVFPDVEVRVSGNGDVRLTARLRGGSLASPRTARRRDPKAVTFHQFTLERGDRGWRACFVVDI
ncbi:MAG TPA: archease, partial [Thermodesulfobacteriota bacterium]